MDSGVSTRLRENSYPCPHLATAVLMALFNAKQILSIIDMRVSLRVSIHRMKKNTKRTPSYRVCAPDVLYVRYYYSR